MKSIRSHALFGSILFVASLVLGFYTSERNCLKAFITKGYINFWTAIEIIGGLAALVGIIIAIIAYKGSSHIKFRKVKERSRR